MTFHNSLAWMFVPTVPRFMLHAVGKVVHIYFRFRYFC